MSQIFFSICLILISRLLVIHTQRIDDLLVNTNYGYVLGSLGYSRNLREYASFRGIPFAQPPVGDLRFQNPLRPKLWNSPYNATVDAPMCLQLSPLSPSREVLFEGEEDCLYLNIYVPIIEDGSSDLLPVMVFIPGGGFVAGGSDSNMYGPQYFMDKDIILVTFNYRLGPLGFLSTLDDEAPGNYAFKDQVMALRFVNENIENFGGDKERVTLFGESAGSGSVGIQLLSPLSDGLFQQAIGQSGAAWGVWVRDHNELQLNTTNTLATFVGCDDFIGDSKNLTECLRSLDAETIVGTIGQFQIFADAPTTPYRTVTETKTERNPDPFLEKPVLDYIKSGEFKKIPYIIGTNQDEGILFAAQILKVQDLQNAFNANFDEIVSGMLYFNPGFEEDSEGLLQNLTEFYLEGDHFVNVSDSRRIQGFIDMVTDRMFLYPTDKIIISQYLNGPESIWVYNFAYRGNHSMYDSIGSSDIDFNWGVGHADDLLYLFYSPEFIDPSGLGGADAQVSEDLLGLWTNFATFGNPDPNDIFLWNKLNFESDALVSNENLSFLNITGSFAGGSVEYTMQQGYNLDRMEFWSHLKTSENS